MSQSDAVLELLRDVRQTQLEQAAELGRIGSTVDSLAGPQGRVTKLESAQTRNFWVGMVSPVLAVLYGVARKMGVVV